MEVFNNLCQAAQRILGSCFRSGIARFASADTIVPDPTSPQSFNRFSYVRNNPLRLLDPSGHCEQYDSDLESQCKQGVQAIRQWWWNSHLETGVDMPDAWLVDLYLHGTIEVVESLMEGFGIDYDYYTPTGGPPQFIPCTEDCPGPKDELNTSDAVTWELGVWKYRMNISDEITFGSKSESSFCFILCWPDKDESSIFHESPEGPTESNKHSTPIGVGIEGEVDGVALGISYTRQTYEELTISPNDNVTRSYGVERSFSVNVVIFSFESTTRVSRKR